jgi:MFS family permease
MSWIQGFAAFTARRGLYFGWIVVAVTFLTLLTASAVRGLPGVIIKPLEGEFGWDRAAISFAVAVSLFMYGLAGPISGRLIDRFGPRWVTVGGILLATVGSAALLVAQTLFELNLWWGVLVGLGSGAMAVVLGAAIATRWFFTRRGLVTGILGAGMSAGQLIFVPLMMALTLSYGWRAAVVLTLLFLVLVVLPLAILFLRNEPADLGLAPFGAPPAVTIAAGPVATPLGRALRTADFWLLACSFFICGFTTTGLIGTHLIPHALEHGFSESVAAGSLAVLGAMNVVGTTASGYLTDRYNPRLLLMLYYGFRAVSLVFLPFAVDNLSLTVFAVLFGLDYIATVPPTVALTADRFGRASVGTLFGWIFCAHQVGAAVSSYGGGLARVWFGDYQLAFLAAGGLAFVAAALSLRISAEEQPAPAPT